MGEIITTIYEDLDFTLFKVIGSITPKDVFEEIKIAFSKKQTKYALWDFVEGDATHLGPKLMGKDDPLFSVVGEQKGRKAAFVFSRDVDFGHGRMLESHLELLDYPITIKSFRSVEDAYAWLGINPPE